MLSMKGKTPEQVRIEDLEWQVRWLVRQARDDRLSLEERVGIIANFPADEKSAKDLEIIPMEFLTQWDELSLAVDRVVTALPFSMTEAMGKLEVERRTTHELLYRLARNR